MLNDIAEEEQMIAPLGIHLSTALVVTQKRTTFTAVVTYHSIFSFYGLGLRLESGLESGLQFGVRLA